MDFQQSNQFQNSFNTNDESIDFNRYLSLFISNWHWFAITLFVSLCIAYGINRWSEKVFTVSSSLLIKDDQNGALTEIFPGSEGFRSQQKVNNEIGILRSFNLNHRVMMELPEFWIVYTSVGRRGIAETRLYKTSPFVVVFDSLQMQVPWKKVNIRIISQTKYRIEIDGQKNFVKELSFGEKFSEEGFNFYLELRHENYQYNFESSNRFYFYFSDPVTLANEYRSKLSVTPIQEDASLVTLSTTGFVPEQEVDYLNTLMRVYLESGLEYKNQTAAQTIDFIEQQLGTISDSLKIAENDLERFRYMNKLIDISRAGILIQDKVQKIDAENTRLLMQKNYYEYLKDYIDSKREDDEIISPSVMDVNDPMLIKLVENLSELQLQKRQLLLNLNESSKPIVIVENSITEARKALNENVSEGLRNTIQLLSSIDIRMKNVELEIVKLPSTERQMINIQRKFDINNTVYTFLLEKRAEAGIARASNVPDNRIIDKAGFYNSIQIKPQEKKNLTLGFLFGVLFPAIAIIIIDYLNNTIVDKKDIEKKTNVPVIGSISHNKLNTELPIDEKPGSILAESFRSLRTNLKYYFRDTSCPVISVTSTLTGEGKTFISTNLALVLSMSGKKVLLIGLDLRKPRIHKIFNIKNEKGISNFLINEGEYSDYIIDTHIKNLWFVSAGPIPPNPAELIDSLKMKDFIKRAKEQFDFIIIDTPPIAIVTDALLTSAFSDFYLFVVRQRYSSKDSIELINELCRNDNIKRIGIVINDINTSGYYSYGLRYGYSFGYGYSYGYNYVTQDSKFGYTNSSKDYYKE